MCKNFEDYAQATAKASGDPTIIRFGTSLSRFWTCLTFFSRLMTIEGNMNPKMSEVDIVPDDDLNTRLKFYVSDKTDTDSTSNPIRRTNA